MTHAAVSDERWNLLFGVRRSVRYHMRRRRFFEFWHTAVLVLAAMSGSVTIVAFGSQVTAGWPIWVKLLPPAFITMAVMTDALCGFAKKAYLHGDLARRFIGLEQRFATGSSKLDVAKLTRERLAIEMDEPPILRVLDTLCRNELARAMGCPEKDFLKVSWDRRLVAPLFDWRFDSQQQPPAPPRT